MPVRRRSHRIVISNGSSQRFQSPQSVSADPWLSVAPFPHASIAAAARPIGTVGTVPDRINALKYTMKAGDRDAVGDRPTRQPQREKLLRGDVPELPPSDPVDRHVDVLNFFSPS